MLKKILILLVMSTLLVTPVFAGDTDPSGTQLKKVLEDQLENAPADDADARKLKSMGGVSALEGASNGGSELACFFEIASMVGLVIWKARAKDDVCNAGLYEPMYADSYRYCVEYSNHCGHWVWEPDCLKSHSCPYTR